MNNPAPPWCLQWNFDGELAPADRDDLEHLLHRGDRDPVQQLLSQVVISGPSKPTTSTHHPQVSC